MTVCSVRRSLILTCLCALPAVAAAAVYDFNADGTSDILWHNSSSGQVSIWELSNGLINNVVSPGTPSATWVIQGVGDFNNDNNADIIWRDSSSGQVSIWLMTNGSIDNVVSPGTPTADWVIQGVGDFNNDNNADILWRNGTSGQVSIWLMTNGGITNVVSPGTPTADWVIQGVGDFNNDNNADILWRNSTSGQVSIWLMTNGEITNVVSPGTPTADWVIQGIGDFNHDGNADIVWRNSNSGQVSIWLMTNGQITNVVSPGAPTADWVIQGIGDFNHDGDADIVWRNSNSGQVSIWLMNNGLISTVVSPGTPTTDWVTAEHVATPATGTCPDARSCAILTEHNIVRANGPFGPNNPLPGPALPPLAWSSAAAMAAASWASQCNGLTHGGQEGIYGQNISTAEYPAGPLQPPTGAFDNPEAIVRFDPSAFQNAWAQEASGYNEPTNTCTPIAPEISCGHYTQVVWRQTTQVGCATQWCTTNSPDASFPDYNLTVCDYFPAGNANNQPPY